MSRPRALLLDLMQTLVHDPFFVEVPAFFGLSLTELLAAKDRAAWLEFEHGRVDEADYLPRFFADRRAFDAPGLLACLAGSYRWLEGMEALVAELARRGVAMHALSNYSAWVRLVDEACGLSRWIGLDLVSFRTGARKPAPEAYLGAARALGLAPGECLFVDDRELNCAAAEAQGMPAVRFTGAPALRAELARRGLLD